MISGCLARSAGLAGLLAAALGATCTSADSTSRSAPAPTPPAPALDASTPVATIDASAPVATIDASGPVASRDAFAGTAVTADYAAVVRAADWARWPGLPPALRERDLVRALGLPAATSRRDVRLSSHDAVLVDTGALRYWLRDRDHVVLVEVTGGLGSTAPADLLARLGPADREGAGRFLQSGATTTEHVFAARGLAITVGASYATPPSFPPRLAAIQLFAPTDLRTFVLDLGGNDRAGPVGPRIR